jgi:DNA-binding protein H-NS
MARKSNLASMSVDALLKLRDDIGNVLTRKAKQLTEQLSRLDDESGSRKKAYGSAMKGRKVAVKFRDKAGNTWAGRGAQPVWLREQLKAGAKLEDFAVGQQRTARKKRGLPRRAKK